MLTTALILLSVITIILLIGLGVRNHKAHQLIEAQKKQIGELIQIKKDHEDVIRELQHEKQQLFSVVSHDLKGPFNRAFALVQLLQSTSAHLDRYQLEYVAKMHIVIADALAMFRNISDIKKMEGKGIEIYPEAFNFSPVLGALAKNYKAIAEKKNIHLHLDLSHAMMVHTDKHCVQRILENLLSNAVKFSGENSHVYIKAQEDEAWITVEVRDEGPGISEEDQVKLFKKFQTLTATPTAGETATGLGLSVARALADKIGAELSCVSNLNKGTRFTLRIRKEKPV